MLFKIISLCVILSILLAESVYLLSCFKMCFDLLVLRLLFFVHNWQRFHGLSQMKDLPWYLIESLFFIEEC